jgi:hypothetical protein
MGMLYDFKEAYWVPEFERSSALSVGFETTSVKVRTAPLLIVEVKIEVTSSGANDVTCPRLLVV